MTDGIMISIGDDGVARMYDDTYDITIHCETQAEHDEALKILRGPQWITCDDALPEEKINENTQDFEKVLCSTTFGDVRAYGFGRSMGYERPHFWHGPQIMDKYVLAWMPMPDPWKGEENGNICNRRG